MLRMAESLPLGMNEDGSEHKEYYEAARSDLRIAMEFVNQIEQRNPPGVVARRQILEHTIAQVREGRGR